MYNEKNNTFVLLQTSVGRTQNNVPAFNVKVNKKFN